MDHVRASGLEAISDEAIQLTEVFEYAMSLARRDFCLPSLQVYKFLYATRLLDASLVEEGYKYLSVIGNHVVRNPQCFSEGLANSVLLLAERIQYHPSCLDECSHDWINALRLANQSGQVRSKRY